MQLHRRKVLYLAAAAVPAVSRFANAQSYPTRPVRIIVPYAPGGSIDVLARPIAQKLSERLGRQFFVENIGGAGGNLGTARGARAGADGYTMVLVGSPFVINPLLYDTVPYDPVRDFDPVTLPLAAPVMLAVNPSLPAQTLKDLVTLIRANPGKYSYASAGTGGRSQLTAELLKQSLKLDLVHVPFNGAGPAVISALAGHTPLIFNSPAPMVQHVKDGTLRALAVMTKTRLRALPDVPTIAESGYPDIEGEEWYGIVVPAGTPKEIIALLNREVMVAIALPEIGDPLAKLGFEPVATATPEAFAARIKAETEKWGKVIQAAHIKAE